MITVSYIEIDKCVTSDHDADNIDLLGQLILIKNGEELKAIFNFNNFIYASKHE